MLILKIGEYEERVGLEKKRQEITGAEEDKMTSYILSKHKIQIYIHEYIYAYIHLYTYRQIQRSAHKHTYMHEGTRKSM